MPTAALLRSFPAPDALRDKLRLLAMLDAILAPDARSFEFHPRWGAGEVVGAYKDGCGNFFFAWFGAGGAVVRGFDHDSPMSPFRTDPPEVWPGLWDGLPPQLGAARDEPAFVAEEITFAFWRLPTHAAWRAGTAKPPREKDADGAEATLEVVHRPILAWAPDLYERELDGRTLAVLESGTIDAQTLLHLNPGFDAPAVREEAELLGFEVDLEGGLAARPTAKKPKARRKAKAGAAPKSATPPARSFGSAEFVVRCEPTRVRMLIGGKKVVAEASTDVYSEIFDWVKARLRAAARDRR